MGGATPKSGKTIARDRLSANDSRIAERSARLAGMKQLVLENLRSAHNVGSIFRTADAVGVERIYLIGYTPTPLDRFGRRQKEIAKTSLGASETVPWEQHDTVVPVLEQASADGVEIVVVEQADGSVPLPRYPVPASVIYVLGNEVTGVSDEALARADTIVEIPMLGTKESLNVAVAAGIVLYHGLQTK